jgi:cardiolipin synthase
MSKNSSILNPPNVITIIRIFLVVPVIFFLINDMYGWAFLTFLIAALSDVLDGFLAKRLNMITKFGTILDPIADKILINYTYLILTMKNLIPLFLFFVILLKDLLLIIGSVAEIFSHTNPNDTKIKSVVLGKLSTLSQVLLIAAILGLKLGVNIGKTTIQILIWSVLILSIVAIMGYAFKNSYYLKGESNQ